MFYIDSVLRAQGYTRLSFSIQKSSKEVLNDLKKFLMRYVYCDTEKITLVELRAAKWRAHKKKSTTRLPPDSNSLQFYLKRANYLSFIQKHPTLQSHPSPLGHGWQLVDGLCLPVSYDLPALPSSIPVTLNMTDDEERDMDSECDSEKVDRYSSDSESTDSSSSNSYNDDNDRIMVIHIFFIL